MNNTEIKYIQDKVKDLKRYLNAFSKDMILEELNDIDTDLEKLLNN